MSDHEILMELLEEKRRNEKQRKIQLIITAVVIAALIIALAVVWAKFSASRENQHRDPGDHRPLRRTEGRGV